MSKYLNKGWRKINCHHYIKEMGYEETNLDMSIQNVDEDDWILVIPDFDDFKSEFLKAPKVSDIQEMAENIVASFLEKRQNILNELIKLVKDKTETQK